MNAIARQERDSSLRGLTAKQAPHRPGTAKTSDRDYVAQTGALIFNPGETTKTITIVVNGDIKKESNETFYLDLFGNSINSLFTAQNRALDGAPLAQCNAARARGTYSERLSPHSPFIFAINTSAVSGRIILGSGRVPARNCSRRSRPLIDTVLYPFGDRKSVV